MLDNLQLVNAEAPWFFALVVTVFGACIGSFLNVCIYRIPKGESVAHPRSHCSCGKRIAWYDNIPIASWFILRGRARCCGARFSFRYPFVEMLTAGLFLACWLLASPAVALCWMLFVALMICATFVDLDTMTIPDRCSIGGMLLGLLLSALVPQLHTYGSHVPNGFTAFVLSLQGAFIGSALVYWIMVLAEIILGKPAMGEGDVKLMGAIGAFCGWQGAVFSLFGGAVLGCIVYFAFMLVQWALGTRKVPAPEAATVLEPSGDDTHAEGDTAAVQGDTAATAEGDTAAQGDTAVAAEGDADNADDADGEDEDPAGAIPFGPALAGGAIVYLFFFEPLVARYFSEIRYLFMVEMPW